MISFSGLSDQMESVSFDGFREWIRDKREVQFDIETNVTDHWCDKKLHIVSFGTTDDQWVIDWQLLNTEQQQFIRTILEDPGVMKIIHYAMFECTVCLFHGVRIRNVFDTLLAEQVLYGGDQETMTYSLEDICLRRLGVQLEKRYQTTFGAGALSVGQVYYAAQDVTYLQILKTEMWQQLQNYGLEWAAALEFEAVLAFSEMVYKGMDIDQPWWINLENEVQPLVEQATTVLNDWLMIEPFRTMAFDYGYISDADLLSINWASGKQKQDVFQSLFPDLPGTTKAVLTKYLREHPDTYSWLPSFVNGNTDPLREYLVTHHKQWLIDHNYLTPAYTPQINWNSQKQVLPLFQLVENIKDLSAQSLGRTIHPIVRDYEDFKDTNKLLDTYGSEWLRKNVEPDGRVRTTFNQVLSTGRISSSKPNMQQIPAKESVGNKYRNAFIPPAGYKFVSSDFVSQELVLIAYLSGDPVWKEALSKGQDLHSIAAEMVFGKKWKDGADPNCSYYAILPNGTLAKEKCKCKKHKYMRNGVKTINFGLAYGMSEFKLASTLRISLAEAKKLIEDYFKAFPGIGGLLNYLGEFGVTKGYIQTIWPIYRKRWFPYWKHYIRFIDSHITKAQYHPGLGEIERASKNMPKENGHVKSGEFREACNCKVMVILSQAILDLGSIEGATTTKMSSNNNFSHERPNQYKNYVIILI